MTPAHVIPAPAKVNLWLDVGEPDDTGFHDLDTLFCALELEDTVTVRPAPPGHGLRLHVGFEAPLVAMPDLGPLDRNLAVRAAAAFLERAGLPRDLELRLTKRIPAGGGLGGGSSDTAAVLRALDRLHPGALSAAALEEVAAGLGSDVPFFASGHTLARGLGRGQLLTPLPPLPPRPVVLALPPVHVATAEAYRWLDEDRHGGDGTGWGAAPGRPPDHPRPRAGRKGTAPLGGPVPLSPDWGWVGRRARNDFEPVVLPRHPVLAACLEVLARHGAAPALLAGSGSSLFGVFEDEHAAAAAAADFRRRQPDVTVLVTATRGRGPEAGPAGLD